MGIHGLTLYDVMKRNARILGDRTAVIFSEKTVSHRDLLHTVDRLAAGLLSLDAGRGKRIGVLSKNCPEFLYLYGAAAKIGAIVLPINWRLSPDEVDYVIRDGDPSVFFVDSEFQPMLDALKSRGGLPDVRFSMGERFSDLRAFGDLLALDGGSEQDAGFDDAWVIIHTAAVGGRPRGAVLTHQSLLLGATHFLHQLGLTPADVNLAVLPLFHVAGLIMALAAIEAGGTNVVLPAFDAEMVVKSIAEHKVSFFTQFPPMLKAILDKAELHGHDLSCIRHVLGIDQPATVEQLQTMTGATFWVAYGQSETSGLAALCPYSARPGSAGIPVILADVQVVDDQGQPLSPGRSGEIVVRGPIVFQGYWKLEKETAHTFRDGWHHTGDLGRLDEDGYLWFEGRAPEKELIKPGGENVYPAEVEKVILEHPLVKEAVVIGVPDSHWGEAVKAVCVLATGASLPEAELIEFVASRIARYKKPKHVTYVADLPKSSDGRIDRTKVKAEHGAI